MSILERSKSTKVSIKSEKSSEEPILSESNNRGSGSAASELNCGSVLDGAVGECPLSPPIAAIGLDHQSAPVDIRSRFAIDETNIDQFYGLASEFGIEKCIVLSTCNRTEIYFSNASISQASQLLCSFSGFSEEELYQFTRRMSCVQAATHLFRVASGLESAALGETEIVSQIKEAWKVAKNHDKSGPFLDLTIQKSLEASKRVRTETTLSKKPVSVGSLAVREAALLAGSLEGKKIVILGAGKMGARLAKELKQIQGCVITILSRSLESAEILARTMGAKSGLLADLQAELDSADVLFGACRVSDPLLSAKMMEEVNKFRGSKPLIAIDLGLPPNIEDVCEGLNLIGIDCLNSHLEENLQQRMDSLPQAEEIVLQEISKYNAALIERSVSPTIQALRERGQLVQARNVEWAKAKLSHLDEKDLKVVEELARKMVIGLLEAPIEGLKTNLATPAHQEIVQQLFDLEVGQPQTMNEKTSLQ